MVMLWTDVVAPLCMYSVHACTCVNMYIVHVCVLISAGNTGRSRRNRGTKIQVSSTHLHSPPPSCPSRISLLLIRVFANLLVFLSLAGTSYAIFLAVDNAEASVHRRDFHKAFSEGAEGLKLFLATFQVRRITT